MSTTGADISRVEAKGEGVELGNRTSEVEGGAGGWFEGAEAALRGQKQAERERFYHSFYIKYNT